MAIEDIKKELEQRFAEPLDEFYKRRIIFWNDEDGDFKEEVTDLELSNAKVLILDESNQFSFGAVLQVHGINYYVSVSSFDKKQEANILIRIPGDKKEVKGSLWFNYMIPVPNECIERLVIKDI
mgnify:CR=1 FL=1